MFQNNIKPIPRFTLILIVVIFLLFGAFCGFAGARIQQNIDVGNQDNVNVQQSGNRQDQKSVQTQSDKDINIVQEDNQNNK